MIPIITHDTTRIIDANQEALILFRVELWEIIDQRMIDAIINEDMRALAALRLNTVRDRGELPARIFAFRRHDGTAFQARCKTTKSGDVWQTEFEYLGEY